MRENGSPGGTSALGLTNWIASSRWLRASEMKHDAPRLETMMIQRPTEKYQDAGWLPGVARAGYVARGVVYLLIGVLALMATFAGAAGRTTGAQGALRQLLDVPGGRYILGVVAAGLVCYAAWRLTQGVLDADHHGTGRKALVIRSALIVSASVHLFLAFFAVSILTGWATGGVGTSSWTARIVSTHYGRWIVAVAGLLVIAAGIAQAAKGCTAGFLAHMDTLPNAHGSAVLICRVGLIARGVVFCLIGVFLDLAAWQQDASEAKGLAGVLSSLQDRPFGIWLLAIMAVGLLAFSLYSFIEAGYRHVGQPRSIKKATPGV